MHITHEPDADAPDAYYPYPFVEVLAQGLNPAELHRQQPMVITMTLTPMCIQIVYEHLSMRAGKPVNDNPSKAVGSSQMPKNCVVVDTVEGC